MQSQQATVEDSQLGLETPEKYEQHCILFPTYATKHADDGNDKNNGELRCHIWSCYIEITEDSIVIDR